MIARSVPAVLSPRQRRRHKLRNIIHSAMLLSGMLAILGTCAFLLWGEAGLVWTVILGGLSLVFTPTMAPELVMRLYRAVPLGPRDFPDGYRLVQRLAERAGLASVPRLYYIPSTLVNAFAVGRGDGAAIGVTDGLLQTLSARELAGVLAHEVSHIRNGDLWIMSLADLLSRLTSSMSWVGQFLLILNLPLVMTGATPFPWLLVLLLILAPTLMSLLQLALSRAREYDADLEAAGLTGDPHGLASALAKLERMQGQYWEEILLPGRRMPQPSLLRTHPPTEKRVRRLLDLYEPAKLALPGLDSFRVPPRLMVSVEPPRFHWSSMWY